MTTQINYCNKKKVLRTCAAISYYGLYLINKYLNITPDDYPPSLSYIKKQQHIHMNTIQQNNPIKIIYEFQPPPHSNKKKTSKTSRPSKSIS